MYMDKEDYLKKALLDTQERVRDYMNYSQMVEDKKLKKCFGDFAKTEGKHAKVLQDFLKEIESPE